MKKIASLIISVCIGGGSALQAQTVADAYKLSQQDINGTARYLSMGGAFGALGGDISSMHSNPAGLGIYRSSEVVGTVSLNIFNTNTTWYGQQSDMRKTTFNLDNFGYVGYVPTGNSEGLVSWNVGVSFNKLKNFNRRYKARGTNLLYSISDYIAAYTDQYGVSKSGMESSSYNANSPAPWMSLLGYYGGLIDYEGNNRWRSDMAWYVQDENGFVLDENGNKIWEPYDIEYAQLEVREWGGIDQYNFSFATNISNTFFIGANIGVTDINYRLDSFYDEDFGHGDYLQYDNLFRVDGTGVDFNLGVIVRPSDYFRFGVAYNSPTWYKLTNETKGYAVSDNADRVSGEDSYMDEETPWGYHDYKFRTPDKWIFSAAGIIGTKALISVDYELSNFRRSHYSYENGGSYGAVNDEIKDDYRNMSTIKVGAEYRLTPQFSIRAGGAWQTSSATKQFQDNIYQHVQDATLPHFTVDRGAAMYSVGLGYRFTPNFYMDMAYVYRQQKENAHVFSFVADHDLEPEPADLKINTSRIALTMGFKF